MLSIVVLHCKIIHFIYLMSHYKYVITLFLKKIKGDLMKKIGIMCIIGMVVLSGLGATALRGNDDDHRMTMTVALPSFVTKENKDDYVTLEYTVEGSNQAYLMNPGEPMLPKTVQSFELEAGVTNIQVTVVPTRVRTEHITKEILPAPVLQAYSNEDTALSYSEKDEALYASTEPFPSEWYDTTVGVGLNAHNVRVTHLSVGIYPVRYIPAEGTLLITENVEVRITYDPPSKPVNFPDEYDLVIIAPQAFASDLQPLVEHKNAMGMRTILKTTEDIYNEFQGRDKPEQIKYFIKDAIEQWNITYVLLVGGLKSVFYGQARDDTNQGTRDWYLPVRYANNQNVEPGIITDLYFADIYKVGMEFDSWDSNNDDIFAEWKPQRAPSDILDLYPDVNVGRLACRSNEEVQTVVEKIITYESTSPQDKSWFNKIITISGDGFLDQDDLDIQWDTTGLPNGAYTIYAQSNNPDGDKGPIEEIHITIDKTVETVLTFNHDDYLRVPNFPQYPAPPIAEIVSVSEGDILGNTDFSYNPSEREAYCNDNTGWARIQYQNGILHIRGKTYDPEPYGNLSDIHVWVTNAAGEEVFSDWRYDSKMYFEGDWLTGEKLLHGRAGGLYYMPEEFDREILWSSNGNWYGPEDVLEAFSAGSGFMYFMGHASPFSWGNHYPGIPGNRQNADVDGLNVVNIKYTFPFVERPLLPMNELTNGEKLPIVAVGGCHNSMFSVSILATLLDKSNSKHTHCYGVPTPECWSWYMVKIPNGGAIATMGNTGYGIGTLGEWCTVGGCDGWINTEFFRQYGEFGHETLGITYSQTLSSYFDTYGKSDGVDVVAVQQWVLLGDPSLMIGGYE
jgi:hypothetical protein